LNPRSESPLTRTFDGGDYRPFGRRLRSPRGARLPLIVVTGFLGAGKTTLIRNFLREEDGANSLVIVNEFGEVGIDDALLRTGGEATVLVGNGCMCCVLRSDLQKTLVEILADRARGELPPFERVILETSGLADPVPILQTLTADRGLASQIHVQAVVAVVDAALGARTLESAPEARHQAAVADRFIITKSDVAGSEASEDLERRLSAINPTATLTRAKAGKVEPAVLLADSASLAEPVYPDLPKGRHAGDVETFCLRFDEPLDWAVYDLAMGLLARLRGADLLRAKGILAVAGCEGPVVVHQVQHMGAAAVELEDWPAGDRVSRLVFIVRGIPQEDVEALFALTKKLAAEGQSALDKPQGQG
jgi:G3E family GTPase